ncbi:hypothetical protein EV360DRAFT_87845 [Lentinula raphanica]|nr:hypothetical protein EV360DRAFT_87845 [Lentinula raphanica]
MLVTVCEDLLVTNICESSGGISRETLKSKKDKHFDILGNIGKLQKKTGWTITDRDSYHEAAMEYLALLSFIDRNDDIPTILAEMAVQLRTLSAENPPPTSASSSDPPAHIHPAAQIASAPLHIAPAPHIAQDPPASNRPSASSDFLSQVLNHPNDANKKQPVVDKPNATPSTSSTSSYLAHILNSE